MAQYRIALQTAQPAINDTMRAVSAELETILESLSRTRSTLPFSIRARDRIGGSLRNIEKELEAEKVFSDLLAGCADEVALRYGTAELMVLSEYGVDVSDRWVERYPEQKIWDELLKYFAVGAVSPLLAAMLASPVGPVFGMIAATLGWAAMLRVWALQDPDGMPEEGALWNTGLEISEDVLGIPVEMRFDLDVLKFERTPGDGYDLEEIRSALFGIDLEMNVGDWLSRDLSLGIGNTDSYFNLGFNDMELGPLQTALMILESGLSGDGMLQGSLIQMQQELRIGTEEYNVHQVTTNYLGEAHAQFGGGNDRLGEDMITGIDMDYGVSAIKGIKSAGFTWDEVIHDLVLGVDVLTLGNALKAIYTNQRFEIGKGFGGGEFGGYAGIKVTGY